MIFSDLLEDGKYLWGGRWGQDSHGIDCLGLAMEVRSRLFPDLKPLPDFPKIYTQYKRRTLPTETVLELVLNHPNTSRVDAPVIGDLAVIEGARGMTILGTFVGDVHEIRDVVIFIGAGEKPIVVPDNNLTDLIGYWRFE